MKLKLKFNAGVEYDHKLILSSIGINGLWVYDLISHKIIAYRKFEREEKSYAIHRKAFLYRDEAWFIPQNGNYIAIVNLINYEISYMELQYQRLNKKGIDLLNAKTYDGGIIEEQMLYMVPSGIGTLNVIDMKEKKIRKCWDIDTGDNVLTHGFYWKKSIYLYFADSLKMKKIDIETEKITEIDLSAGEVAGMVYGEAVVDHVRDMVYIGSGKNNAFVTCVDLKKMTKYQVKLDQGIVTEHASYFEGKAWFWGVETNRVVIFDPLLKKVQIRTLDDDEKAIYIFIDSIKDNMILSRDGQCWYRHVANGKLEKGEIEIEFNDIKEILERDTDQKIWDIWEENASGMIHEEYIPLEYFLKNL